MPDDQGTILPGIDHIVVLMLENRSFDNILGWLYDPANAPPYDKVPEGQTFDGVSGKGLTNPGPNGTLVPVGFTSDTTNPFPDPGEEYQKVYGQLYNQDPPPDGAPPDPPQPPPMTGFVNNYAAEHPGKDPSHIMNGFRPRSLPSFSLLAHSFMVCDRWFAPVPSQTLANRSFVHAGTSSGHVNNKDGEFPIFINATDTIYDLLQANGVDWRIYYGSHWFLCNAFATQKRLEHFMLDSVAFEHGRFQPFRRLLDAAASGTLPAYSFVEPNFLDSLEYGRENDMHPDAGLVDIDRMPSDARFGDDLVRKLYQALKNGPQWHNTLLIITFDEHGGCYDHVPPGAADPPDDRVISPGQPGYSGFKFDRYGVRVPALLISPRLPAGVVDHTIYDHTSIIRTVMGRFGVPGNLGQRVATANPIDPPMVEPRTDVPDLSDPVVGNTASTRDSPLNGLRETLAKAAISRLHGLLPEGLADLPEVESKLKAEEALLSLADKWLRSRLG